jgi:hypothetical protein
LRRSVDEVASSKYSEEFKEIVEEGRYSLKQIFNFDETGALEKNAKLIPDTKPSRMNQIIDLLGGNANSDYKLKPVLVCHSQHPRAFRGIRSLALQQKEMGN